MKCYFLRHGLAGDPEQWPGDDFARPLTAAGEQRMAREAKTLAALALDLNIILTSPLVRAKQTAAIVAEKLDVRVAEDARLGSGFNTRALGEILHERAQASAIMLVGHEPSMSATIGSVVGAARLDLKKGGLACVNFDDPDHPAGELLWLVPPKILAL
ncbi:MAG: histidine phosphatase family protein [Candidatus Eremiobacteraeota bacterium]|nr:histidine phosphatase family protein [Candidatus Eremiobacteraeota bacterium]